MKNYLLSGKTWSVAAPRAVASGEGALIGVAFGVAANAYANGEVGEFDTVGVYTLTANGADTPSAGALCYWDNTAFRVTTTATGNTKIGYFWEAKASGATTAVVRLNGAV